MAALAAGVCAPAAQASANCSVAGAKRIASDGRLVVIQATQAAPTTGSYSDVDACIGAHPPRQLDVLSSVDGPCWVREVRVTSQRYVGVDVRCDLASIGAIADTIFSFNVAQARVWRGTTQGSVEHLRAGFVLARNGAIAYIRDTSQGTIVYACDTRAKCLNPDGQPSHQLDHAHDSRTIGDLRITGNAISWRHGHTRRNARLN
jgi:hypothetical protein